MRYASSLFVGNDLIPNAFAVLRSSWSFASTFATAFVAFTFQIRKRCAVHKRHASDSHGPDFDGYGDLEDESQFGINDGYKRQVEDHKKAISRPYRHQWARANTPPGYWNIGFPDTQEAVKEEAEEMHRKKQEEVERSIKREYRRRS